MTSKDLEMLIQRNYELIDNLKDEHVKEIATRGHCICRLWDQREQLFSEIDRHLIQYRIAADLEIANVHNRGSL
jgi:hypothetical protein